MSIDLLTQALHTASFQMANEDLAPVHAIYTEHKVHLDSLWDRVECKAKQLQLPANKCWTFTLPGMELNDDGYLRYRWEVATDKKRERVVAMKNGMPRKANCTVRKKHAVYMHHLSCVRTITCYTKRIHLRRGNKIFVRYTITHLCGNRKCFRPDHVHCEPHRLNLSRIKCWNEICWHTPKCLQTLDHVTKAQIALQAEVSNDIGVLVSQSL